MTTALSSEFVQCAARRLYVKSLVSVVSVRVSVTAMLLGIVLCILIATLLEWKKSILLGLAIVVLASILALLFINTYRSVYQTVLETFPVHGNLSVEYGSREMTISSSPGGTVSRPYEKINHVVARKGLVVLSGADLFWMLPPAVCPPDRQQWLVQRIGRGDGGGGGLGRRAPITNGIVWKI